ncbi:MAG: hypothetical protein J3R72DRAFT_486959 [Linnemannia gamsii]|nr:MAG: hypothetical protein J3R72DRAFT_486959 [Linnemannia gamsii]
MVKLSLPLQDYDDIDEDSRAPQYDPSQSIYNGKHCIQNFMFCSDDNPCPSNIPCINQVCQCLPNKQQYITLTPLPHRMYTVGCNFDKTREMDTCRTYEYAVGSTCVLNYCSKDVPCFAGICDTKHHVCVNMTSTRAPLPISNNQIITLDDSPFDQRKDVGYPPLLIIMVAAATIAGLAVVGCLIRLMIHLVRGSVTWAFRSHKLPSDEIDRYSMKDDYSYSITDAKYVADPEAISGVTMVKVPGQFSSAHGLSSPVYPSTDSLDYANPPPSPQFTTFVQDLNEGLPHSQSHTSLAHLDGTPPEVIKMETQSFLNDPQDPAVDIDPSHRLSIETRNMVQSEEPSPLAGERGSIARPLTVSHPTVIEGSDLQKSGSLNVRGSKTLPLLPLLPPAATVKGSSSTAAAITTLANELLQAPLTPSSSPESYRSPISIRNGRAPRLTLKAPLSSHISLKPLSGSIAPIVPSTPLQPSYASAPSSPFITTSSYPSSYRSSNSLPGSPSSPNGLPRSRRLSLTSSNYGPAGYNNYSPVDRNLPAGFASSPVAKTAPRFD